MTQDEAFAVLASGANVFLTGEPGAGKTHTLNRYITYCHEHKIPVAVTASTGIAATHIGGMTIHAWSGIGIKDSLTPYDLDQLATRESLVKRVNAPKVLVIDEISMLDAQVLTMVDQVLRTLRRSREPFGGLQVILVGDFFQLPPIGRNGASAQFAFDASVWHELRLLTCYLSEQYRQEDDTLLGLLGALRRGEVDEYCYDILESCAETAFGDGIEPTRLYTHNADVDTMNAKRLGSLNGDAKTYTMEGHGRAQLVEGLKRSCLSPETLELKIGAMVMCTKNNFDSGYVNGTLGTVVGYAAESGHPQIETFDGETLTVAPASWSVSDGDKILAEVHQIPLRLAWAITVHKSQGMSLDAAEIDLSRAFTYGQGYVALSRVRSLAGLLLRGCNDRALAVDPRILERDAEFQEQSRIVQDTYAALSAQELAAMHTQFITACGGTLERTPLSESERNTIAKKDTISTYEKTRRLLSDGLDIEAIAQKRGVADSTVYGHLEKLATEGALTFADIAHLVPKTPEEKESHAAIAKAIAAVGAEKLKPIREKLGGAFTYDEIRLVRLLHTIATQNERNTPAQARR